MSEESLERVGVEGRKLGHLVVASKRAKEATNIVRGNGANESIEIKGL